MGTTTTKATIISFKMNRKCAAGMAVFMEEIAHRLDIPVGDLNGLAQAVSKTAQIGSYCTVLAATEVIGSDQRW